MGSPGTHFHGNRRFTFLEQHATETLRDCRETDTNSTIQEEWRRSWKKTLKNTTKRKKGEWNPMARERSRKINNQRAQRTRSKLDNRFFGTKPQKQANTVKIKQWGKKGQELWTDASSCVKAESVPVSVISILWFTRLTERYGVFLVPILMMYPQKAYYNPSQFQRLTERYDVSSVSVSMTYLQYYNPSQPQRPRTVWPFIGINFYF